MVSIKACYVLGKTPLLALTGKDDCRTISHPGKRVRSHLGYLLSYADPQ
ncbi:MAG TPA: hypothetical protein V6C91_08500 [Coleofasciculaceae cyanobacterium]